MSVPRGYPTKGRFLYLSDEVWAWLQRPGRRLYGASRTVENIIRREMANREHDCARKKAKRRLKKMVLALEAKQ